MKTWRPTAALLVLVALGGCNRHAPATVGATSTANVPAASLPWIQDDWPKAIEAGRAAHKAIVVDLWAAWCTYCTAADGTTMRAQEVLALRDRFVWARINTDKPENGDLLTRLTVQGLPDYLVLDPADESIVGRQVGSGSTGRFRNMLRDADRVYQAAHAAALAADDPLRLEVEGQRAARKGDHAGAADLFRRAVAAAPAAWDRRDDTIDSEVTELIAADRVREGIAVALAIPETDHSSDAADAIATAADDLDSLPKDTKDRAALTRRLLDRMLAMANDAAAPIATDVRDELWDEIVTIYEARGDSAKARDARQNALAVLDAAATQAPDALAASAYNTRRTAALVKLGRPQEAIAMLRQSEKDLPNEPDPPYRLAQLLEGQKRYDEAISEVDKAIPRGQKKFAVQMMYLRATLQREAGHNADSCTTLRNLVTEEATLPGSERMPAVVERTQKQLKASCGP